MSTGTTPGFSLGVAPQRKVPRYKLTVPLDLTVLRSGVPDNIPGRTLEIGEGGVGVVASSPLLIGESVRVEFLLPHMTTPVRATAIVRYQRERCFGLQFLRLPVEQQSIIRYWTRREGEVLLVGRKSPPMRDGTARAETPAGQKLRSDVDIPQDTKRRFRPFVILAVAGQILFIAAALGWWQWERGWRELEAPVLAKEASVRKPQLTVPPEVMQRRIRHQTMPEYPEVARQARIQGTVVLDAIVNPEGAVTQLKVVSGPDLLSKAATNAVRWWRYEPYLLDGQPVTVETTIVVSFQLAN
jgi:TonB family protein